MTALLAPLWDPPARDAPGLQKQAYRRMVHTLRRLEARFPGILANPTGIAGDQVLEAATAALLNPAIPREIRVGALTMLQRRMRSVDPSMPERLYLARDPHHNPIAADFSDRIARLEAFEASLHRFIAAELPRRLAAPRTGNDREDALLALGVLEAVLVTRLGCCSLALLARIVALVGRRPTVCGKWAWVDVALDGAGSAPQLRRIFLDPVGLAAWIRAQKHAEALPRPPQNLKAGRVAAFRRSVAAKAFKALAAQLPEAADAERVRSLHELCEAEAQRLYLTTMPLLATFAKGEIVSSSIEPNTWGRLLGCAPSKPEALLQDEAADGASTALPSDVPSGGHLTLAEGLAEGDLDEHGLIAQLRSIMNGPRAAWKQGFDALLAQIASQPEASDVARCVVAWLRYLACDYRSKGKALRDGSVRGYRGLLAQRLLQYLPRTLKGIDEDELHDAYAEIVLSRTSPGQTRNLRMALGAFDRFIRTIGYSDLPRTSLVAGEGGSYAISNRIISEPEYQAGLRDLEDGSLVTPNARVKFETRAFWILAFRLGMRRREILGLQARDLDINLVRVRKNAGRTLKTANASRLLTMYPIPRAEQDAVRALGTGRALDAFLFFESGVPSAAMLDAHPAVGFINTLLERVAGDRALHPHNLRHSFATLYLLGALGPDVGLESHPCALPWMKACIKSASAMASSVAGTLHGRAARGAALGLVMGHGSELTTYEHYVHSLDLLLFIACTHPGYAGRAGALRDRLASDRVEIRALLGRTVSFRLPGKDLFEAIPKITRTCGGELTEFHSSTQQHCASALVPRAPTGWFPSLTALLQSDKSVSGYPAGQAQRDTVATLLARFELAAGGNRALFASVLARWFAAKMANSDWASMDAAAALSWVSDLASLGASDGIEVLQVSRDATGDVKRKRTVARPFDRRFYRQRAARYWIRFADERDTTRRKRALKTSQRRSRTQGCITWLIGRLSGATSPGGPASSNAPTCAGHGPSGSLSSRAGASSAWSFSMKRPPLRT